MSKKRLATNNTEQLEENINSKTETSPQPTPTSTTSSIINTPIPVNTSAVAASSLSSSSSSSSLLNRKKDLSSRFTLSLQPQPPRHPFLNVYFPIQLFLVDSRKVMKTGWNLTINVELLYENGELVADQSLLEISPQTPPRINGDGQVSLQLRMKQVSMKHENRNFFIRFSVAKLPIPTSTINNELLTNAQLTAITNITPVQTTLMTVIRHRLKITEQPPSLWYKDEGGRDKCITLRALLVDEDDVPVKNREVPLRVSLCYEGEDGMEVKNQSILKFPSESLINKIDAAGQVELKVRIEEVSKNHQKQGFTIKIAPDVIFSPANYDIAADISTPVTVLSKRNKRRKKESGSTTGASSTSGGQMLGGIPTGNVTSAYAPLVHTSSAGMISPMSTLANSASNVHMAASVAQSSSSSLSAGISSTSSNSAPLVSGLINGSSPLSQQLSTVTGWCQYVVRGLISLEWQHVGFEITELGEVHLHRPLHRCPSCWHYRDSIRPAEHHPKCMLALAKARWYKEIAPSLSTIVNAVQGIPADPRLADTRSTTPPAIPDDQLHEDGDVGLAASPDDRDRRRRHRRHHRHHRHHRNSDPRDQSQSPEPGADSQSPGEETDEDSPHQHQEHSEQLNSLDEHETENENTEDEHEDAEMEDARPQHSSSSYHHHGDISIPIPPSADELPANQPHFNSQFSGYNNSFTNPYTSTAGPIPYNAGPAAASHLPPTHPIFQQGSSYNDSYIDANSMVAPDVFSNNSNAVNPSSVEENTVTSIHVIATEFGFPAYNDDNQLLGFYVDDPQRGVQFYPTSGFLSRPQSFPKFDQQLRMIQQQYLTAMRVSPNEIIHKRDTITLERLKEEAVLLMYSRETEIQSQLPPLPQQPVVNHQSQSHPLLHHHQQQQHTHQPPLFTNRQFSLDEHHAPNLANQVSVPFSFAYA